MSELYKDNCPLLEAAQPSGGTRSQDFLDKVHQQPYAVVLIGGSYDKGDVYETPVGRISGLLMNAYAVQAEIQDNGISEWPHWVLMLLDIVLVGGGMHYIFERHWPIGPTVLLIVVWFVVVVELSFLLFTLSHALWLSWVGMFVGSALHMLVDMFLKIRKYEKLSG